MVSQSMRILVVVGVLTLAGCGAKENVVKGTITANGTPVEEGFINFYPRDEKNGTSGAPIENGKFSAKLKPGKYEVVVSGGAKMKNYPKSQEDLKKVADKDLELKDQVPDDAKGNHQEIEVTKDGQELNINLEFPKK